ncbi:dTMP kinase [Methylobacterium sp. Leaf106]|uniref:dTMP kinase n=1 Tax=Methylobacterium sp. Leaf106 TaxID=1736255 RepID=UPI0006F38B04|nr:dTMP kinase [Methylobacterium sp. Leaf106]KQP37671.1 thymidylate kinase [Methylobacterium sp. Leaf106]
MIDRSRKRLGQGGAFITFEGGEGAGKSTQIARLAARLRGASSAPVVTTREPGGSVKAEAIREALLAGTVKRHGPFAEALLFSAARIDHLDTLIRPALARGETVLCDRFSDSTRAYQGAAGGLDPALLSALERVVVGDMTPDLTLILDLDPAIGLARAKARAGAGEAADRFEAEALGFHTRLRQAFLAIAAMEPERCVVIDAGLPPDAVEEAIAAALAARLPGLLSRPEAADDAA